MPSDVRAELFLGSASRPVFVIADGDEAIAGPPGSPWFVLRRDLTSDHVRALMGAAVGGRRRAGPRPPLATGEEARRHQRVFDRSRRLAVQRDLAGAEVECAATVLELTGADRAHCLFYDAASGALWSEARQVEGSDDRRAVTGLAGFCARTGDTVAVAAVGADPRWCAAIDDPDGSGDDRLLAVPIAWGDQVHAVLVAVRGARRPAFGDLDVALLSAYADQAGPLLDQLSSHVVAGAILDEEGEKGLFRPEALAALAQRRHGDVVRVSPRWIAWAYWGLMAVLVAALVFLVVGRVATYSRGTAVVRTTGRADVAARSSGSVAEVAVSPGDRVTAGHVVVRLDDGEQRAELDRLERELELQLRNRMLDLSDEAAARAVQTARAERDRARVVLAERSIAAATDGVIGDIRARVGQHVEPGDVVATVFDPASELEVIALLPGRDRPQLAAGMTLRLELAGYRYAYQDAVIQSIATEVIGPAEARRYLGPQLRDALPVEGPVAVVRARLAGHDFIADGQTFRYHDGMSGQAEVAVGSERILFALVPGLRRLERREP